MAAGVESSGVCLKRNMNSENAGIDKCQCFSTLSWTALWSKATVLETLYIA